MIRFPGTLPACRTAIVLLFLAGNAAVSTAAPGTEGTPEGPGPVTASIDGEVRRPGTYTFPPGATLSALIVAAGGFTDDASPGAAALFRPSARASGEAELHGIAARLSAETDATAEGREAARPVAELLAGLRPAGRVPVRLTHPRLLKGSPADLPLEEGDTLRVPPKTDAVSVAGAVPSSPLSIPFEAKRSYKEYIRKAGGYGGGADRDHVYLLRADGTVALLSLGFVSWNAAESRWEVTGLAGSTPAVGAGDTIVVPRNPPPGLPTGVARELPGLLMRLAEITGAPVVLP